MRHDSKAQATNKGFLRLLAVAAQSPRPDQRLRTGIVVLTGGAAVSATLGGTPDQVAQAMLDHYNLSSTTFLIRSFNPLVNAIQYGSELLPGVGAPMTAWDASHAIAAPSEAIRDEQALFSPAATPCLAAHPALRDGPSSITTEEDFFRTAG